uniref:Uncharacterized protein n=1 Tax=Steinernema glaseri TaxID=37863 RepID=A0A1I8A7L7_9BILA
MLQPREKLPKSGFWRPKLSKSELCGTGGVRTTTREPNNKLAFKKVHFHLTFRFRAVRRGTVQLPPQDVQETTGRPQ